MRSKKVVFPVFTAATIGFALTAYGCQGELKIGDQAKAPTASTSAAPPPPATTSAPPVTDTPAPTPPPPAPKPISLKGVSNIKGAQIDLPGDIEFASGSDVIIMNDKSKSVLNAVLKIMTDNPNLTMLRVEGHTDNQGSAAYNQGLSERRAAAVVKWLVGQKIDSARLHSIGLGPKCPLVANDSATHMATNRRTEFHLEQLDNKKVDADTQDGNGCSTTATAGGSAPPAASGSASGQTTGGGAPPKK
jgi:OOP family OmpA-OmpF porin